MKPKEQRRSTKSSVSLTGPWASNVIISVFLSFFLPQGPCGWNLRQHSQNGTPAFLRETLALCRQLTDAPLLIRLDSGNDSAENIGILLEHCCYFIIKRNLRNESQAEWFNDAREHCQNISVPREGKTVYIGSTWKDVTYTGSDQQTYTIGIRAGYEIIERTIDKYGQFLMPSDIEINTWWTNLGLSDTDIINLYHAHGECEQFHSEIKTDREDTIRRGR